MSLEHERDRREPPSTACAPASGRTDRRVLRSVQPCGRMPHRNAQGAMSAAKITIAEMQGLLAQVPFTPLTPDALSAEFITATAARFRLKTSTGHVRPGGTVSGPALFA